jgi:uncharacterized protein (DUF58 family)
MVPAPRLIWLVVALGFPVAILAAVVPGAQIVALVIMLLFCGIVLADLALRQRSLQGIRVELPATVRAVQKQSQSIPIRIHNPNLRTRLLRLGLAAPEGIDAEWEEQQIQLEAGAAVVELFWKVLPTRRGKMLVEEIYLEAASPFGLWSVRRRDAVSLELRVYPNLRHDSALRALTRGEDGMHHMRQLGRGREFEKLREYAPGDSSDEIHWKATARRGAPITKVFQVERTQEIYVIIDASRLSGRLVADEAALDRAIRATLLIGAAAERRGDLFGLAVFSDRVERFVRARAGKSHYAVCRDAINEIRTRQRAPDFEALATFLRLRLRRRALLIFLTALDEPVLAESFVRATALLARKHLILTGMLQEAGTRALFQNSDVKSVDDVYRELAGHLAWRKLSELQTTLARKGIRFALIEPDAFSSRLIGLYDELKQRQLL